MVVASDSEEAFHTQLDDIKRSLVQQIERVVNLLDQVAQAQGRARQEMGDAIRVKEAAEQAFASLNQLADAQAEAERARTTYEQAAARVRAARQQWVAAQASVEKSSPGRH